MSPCSARPGADGKGTVSTPTLKLTVEAVATGQHGGPTSVRHASAPFPTGAQEVKRSVLKAAAIHSDFTSETHSVTDSSGHHGPGNVLCETREETRDAHFPQTRRQSHTHQVYFGGLSHQHIPAISKVIQIIPLPTCAVHATAQGPERRRLDTRLRTF